MNNYVALRDPATEKFGKLMSLPDHLVAEFALVYTDLAPDDVDEIATDAAAGGASARDAKARMAGAVVARYHGADAADACRAEFRSVFSDRSGPASPPLLTVDRGRIGVLDVLALARPEASGRELRRLVGQGGVSVNDVRVTGADEELELVDGDVLKSGKRTWHEIRVLSVPVAGHC